MTLLINKANSMIHGNQLISSLAATALLTGALVGPAVSTAKAAAPEAQSPYPAFEATDVNASPTLTWGHGQVDLIANGGFENGTFGGWGSFEDGFGGVEIDDGSLDPFGPSGGQPPLAGSYHAAFQTAPFGAAVYFLFQTVTIPDGAQSATLSWSHLFQNFGGFFSDDMQFRVEVRNEANTAALATVYVTGGTTDPFGPWTKNSANLAAFSGQTVTIAFIATTPDDWFNVFVDNVSLLVDLDVPISSQVLLSTSISLGANDILGTTDGTRWPLTDLLPDTTYYWRIISMQGQEANQGPIWEFTTAPAGALDHFDWATISSPQAAGQPLAVEISARDAYGFLVSDFNGTSAITAASQTTGAPLNLLPDQPFTAFSQFVDSTVGYSFTPSSDLWVSGIRGFSGDKVTIWTDTGIEMTSQAVAPVVTTNTQMPEVNGILREVYTGIPGTTLSAMRSSPTFPDSPTTAVIDPDFDAPVGVGSDYGIRMRALLVPPTTGDYTFWITSDDQGDLFLSTDDNPGNIRRIARVNTWAMTREWDRDPNQQSNPIRLEAGRRYYIEGQMKEGDGNDHLTVRWQLPSGVIEEPIPNNRLIAFSEAAPEPEREAAWSESPLDNPVLLQADETYRIGVHASGLTTHYARFDMPGTFAHGTINQGYQAAADGFPTDNHTAEWWFVDLVYSVDPPANVAVAPGITGNFVNGVWSGNLDITGEADQIVLSASDGSGTRGLSGAFDISMAPVNLVIDNIVHAGSEVRISFMAAAGQSYTVHYKDSLSDSSWTPLGTVPAQGTAGMATFTDNSPDSGSRFYLLSTP